MCWTRVSCRKYCSESDFDSPKVSGSTRLTLADLHDIIGQSGKMARIEENALRRVANFEFSSLSLENAMHSSGASAIQPKGRKRVNRKRDKFLFPEQS